VVCTPLQAIVDHVYVVDAQAGAGRPVDGAAPGRPVGRSAQAGQPKKVSASA
jgi:hypothetical protein